MEYLSKKNKWFNDNPSGPLEMGLGFLFMLAVFCYLQLTDDYKAPLSTIIIDNLEAVVVLCVCFFTVGYCLIWSYYLCIKHENELSELKLKLHIYETETKHRIVFEKEEQHGDQNENLQSGI